LSVEAVRAALDFVTEDPADTGDGARTRAIATSVACLRGYCLSRRAGVRDKTARSFACDWDGDCTKSFRRAADLFAHRCVHTGERPHACSKCPTGFAKRSNLLEHQQRHVIADQEGRSIPCPAPGCSFVFSDRRSLARHCQQGHVRTERRSLSNRSSHQSPTDEAAFLPLGRLGARISPTEPPLASSSSSCVAQLATERFPTSHLPPPLWTSSLISRPVTYPLDASEDAGADAGRFLVRKPHIVAPPSPDEAGFAAGLAPFPLHTVPAHVPSRAASPPSLLPRTFLATGAYPPFMDPDAGSHPDAAQSSSSTMDSVWDRIMPYLTDHDP